MHNKVKIDEMTPHELQETMAARPIVYIPLGLIEWHGKHLPLGLDGYKIYGTLMGCVERTGGVILPITWIGAPGFGAFCGTLCYEQEFVRELFERILEQCAKIGAKVIAMVTGHYGASQAGALADAAANFRQRHPDIQLLARPEFEGATVDGEAPADHARKWETSMALAHFPELVYMDRHRPGEEPIHLYADEHIRWDQERKPWQWHEDLRETASGELGWRAVHAIQDVIVRDVETLCEKAGL
ncbi:MAG: creatininase family protein [Verrucomicrobia bacterium]|nr:creatininase family protein [Verrucomicrobiota bacterium]